MSTTQMPKVLRIASGISALLALLLSVTFIWLVPWKSQGINIASLMIAFAYALSALSLWRGSRFGVLLTTYLSMLLLLCCFVVVAALVSSAFYLQGIYGDFGYGAAIVAFMVSLIIFQLLGLIPLLQLCLLRTQAVRSHFGLKIPIKRLGIGLISVLIVCLLAVVYGTHLNRDVQLSYRLRTLCGKALYASLVHDEPVDIRALKYADISSHAFVVSVWQHGKLLARHVETKKSFYEMMRAIQNKLYAGVPALDVERPFTLKMDRIGQTKAVWFATTPLLSLSVRPGIDALLSEQRMLLPDDMLKAGVFGSAPLIPKIREVRLGINRQWVYEQLGTSQEHPLLRAAVESFLFAQGRTRGVYRGNTKGPVSGKENLRKAAIAGGDFMLRQLRLDGRFNYVYLPMKDQAHQGAVYSVPRHAGSAYSLAQLWGQTKLQRFRVGAQRAMFWLSKHVRRRCGSPQAACVVFQGEVTLGSSALSAIAGLEYQRKTSDTRFAEQNRALLNFLLAMQQDNGDFFHGYDPHRKQIDRQSKKMFYSEEAALALVLGYKVFGDKLFLSAAEKALDFLTTEKYSFFLGWFVYGADHWTCIAAEEAYPALQEQHYLDFCEGYADFLSRLQYAKQGWDNRDFYGHYGVGALMVPQAGAAAGFTEAMVSTYLLGRYHGRVNEEVEKQVQAATDALIREQVRADNSYLFQNPEAARGGFRRSLVEPEMRIDFTQHATSALLRASLMHEGKEG
ncbi:MAG: hypothetical protein IPJ88_14910 [Myxococcales bacterium]|nr:MAG: hypothetical protein IPJ88_14910 [Myxococcales bacterium]